MHHIKTCLFKIAILIGIASACRKEQKLPTLFNLLPSSQTSIDFANTVKEDENFNIIQYLYFYNGGGVAIGDINNDGLPDIYFSSNQYSNKLYLNQGKLKFEDITEKAGVSGSGNWKTGVAMADVNGDGWLDIYVCGVGNYKSFNTTNQLYINNGDLTFTERAKEYNLNFSGLSTQASFFDYDLDGDLDVFLLNHSVHSVRSYGRVSARSDYDPLAGDRLYRNELSKGLSQFIEVTDVAGIIGGPIGYGLGVSTADVTMDGYPDIYVSNDFRENDYLFVNQKDGTFKQELEQRLGHSSRFSMGNDVADINNDGLPDILTVDMMPRNESIIKASVGEDSYEVYKFKLGYGYHHQVAHNALQLNNGDDHFSDIAWLSGLADTDWSWAPLIADFDNDGLKDVFISNGIVRRPNDLNYLNFISSDSAQRLPDNELTKMMPEGKISNFIFHNSNGINFEDYSKRWGINIPSNSNGAAYADLDNDGDLDLVISNINEKAFIYENTLHDSSSNYLKVKFSGSDQNKFGVGVKVFLFDQSKLLYQELAPTRGFQSSVDLGLIFGLGNSNQVDSAWIVWPNKMFEKLTSIKVNRTIQVDYRNSKNVFSYSWLKNKSKLFQEIDLKTDASYIHKENDFVDFNTEGLIPRMVSTESPKLAVGDVNSDGLDDFFVGSSKGQAPSLYIQHPLGEFKISNKNLLYEYSLREITNAVFFDADGDQDLDLIFVCGGNEEKPGNKLQPVLLINDGRGNFKELKGALPSVQINASCVKAGDWNGDGDQDLFIGGRVVPGQYGINPPSFILDNDGKGKFQDVSSKAFSGNNQVGMITDASWIDLNKDGLLDLLLCGEWMPLSIFIQSKEGTLLDKTSEWDLTKTNGWWNTLTVNDFDKDGDLDIVAGNLGMNTRLKATVKEPVEMWIDDFDNNGSIEQIITYYNQGKSYPLATRDQLVKQLPSFKKKYIQYKNYVSATQETILTVQQKREATYKVAYKFESTYFENAGGKFIAHTLPIEAQMFPIMSFVVDDLNDDGDMDLMAVGNLYETQPDLGRYDAGHGLVMTGNGKGSFKSLNSSGFIVSGQGRDIKVLRSLKKQNIYLTSRNNQSLVSFKLIK